MKMKSTSQFQAALEIVRTLQNKGAKAVFAGGCVRDMLLGVEPHDIDIATDFTPDQVEALFPRTVAVGKSFGVIRVVVGTTEFEVATFREDAKTGDGRRPDFVKFSTMEADASRRDLTINGMFFDPITEQTFDFVGGEKDLMTMTVRFIGDPNERIEEDALRMLRAIRFAVRFEATLSQKASQAISDNAWRVDTLSGERVFDEMTKILRLHRPRVWMPFMASSGLMKRILPEVNLLQICEQGKPWHCEGNAFEHTIRVLEALPSNASDELLWAALLHDTGKPATSAPSKSHEGSFSFHGHEAVSAELTINALRDRFKTSSDFTFTTSELVRNHMKMHILQDMKMHTARRLLAEPFFEDLMKLSIADETGCVIESGRELAFPKWQKRVAEIRADFVAKGWPLVPGCLLSGKDLIDAGFKPGPIFKVALNRIHDEQLDGKLISKEQALARATKLMAVLK